MKPEDVLVLFNYIWSMPSMKQGETWTPVCVPGCSEEFMLHVYIHFKQPNLGMVIVCTDHSTQCFEQCQDFTQAVFDYLNLPQNRYYAGANKASLIETVDKHCLQMFEVSEMKEV